MPLPAFTSRVESLLHSALALLELLAVFCGLAVFAFAALSLLLATYRVAIRGRVLALPFTGREERRVELTDLFVRRLTEIEQEWIALARDVVATRREVNRRVESGPRGAQRDPTPLSQGRALPPIVAQPAQQVGLAPRTSGDELLDDVVQLSGTGSIANAELGVITFAGVSFSPRDVIALLRALPGVAARRTLRGSISPAQGGALLAVEYHERSVLRPSRRVRQLATVTGDDWLPTIEDVGYRLARERVYLQRDRRDSSVFDAFRSAQQSRTVSRALIEASSWESCRWFLIGYCRQLRHYRDGNATDREDALEAYDDALRAQAGFPTAAYNRATLLYNRYLPQANDEAIAGFEVATASEDPSLRPLAYAGLAMAHCQAIHRFHHPASDHEEPARRAAETAFELAPELEEASFARGWLFQIDSHWTEAVERYEKVAELPGDSAAARRIKSFALNNAAWILLYEEESGPRSSEHAEALLWRAVALYPNKIAYANLAEIARRNDRRDVAVQLFGVALSLDPAYTNGLNERAVVEAELAARSRTAEEAASWREAAQRHAAKAQRLAERDPAFAALLAEQFRKAVEPVSRQEVKT